MPSPETERLQRERDLYARLLDMGAIGDIDALLAEALAVAVAETHARKGLIAVFAEGHERGDAARWLTSTGLDNAALDTALLELSSSIIDDTLVTRRVSMIPSAMGHPKYGVRDSVRLNQITSVVCAPLGSAGLGVLYLQDRDKGIFTEGDEAFIKKMGQAIGRFVDHIVLQGDDGQGRDPTARWRRGGRFSAFVGQSKVLAGMFRKVVREAACEGPVLITGPSGTARLQVARELHVLSGRSDGPMLHFRCVDMPAEEALAELVGTKGRDAHTGLLEIARGGTLVIDGLQHVPLDAQRMLASMLVDGTYRPLGSTLVLRADVRLVAIDAGQNADLSGVLPSLAQAFGRSVIRIPALSERREDLPALVQTIGRQLSLRYHVPWVGVSPEAMAVLDQEAWLHNEEELTQVLERALQLTEGARPIDTAALNATVPPPTEPVGPGFGVLDGPLVPWKDAKKAFARHYLDYALSVHNGNVAATARVLGMSRARLFALRKELDLADDDDS